MEQDYKNNCDQNLESLRQMDGNIESYLDMSDDARWQILVQKVSESKHAGTMTDADLDAFAVTAGAALSPAQKRRLTVLIQALKSGK